VPAVGLSGIDAGLIRAKKRPPVEVESNGATELVDYGFVGDVTGVDVSVILKTLDAGILPVVSPLSADENGTVLNINADTVAAVLAIELRAEKLILSTGAPGILEDGADPGSLISYMDLHGLDRMRDEGRLAAGMLPKSDAIHRALEGGVRRVHVVSHDVPDSLLLEVFTNEGAGTLVVNDVHALTREEQDAGGHP
jgi:acetylglutamate kinase